MGSAQRTFLIIETQRCTERQESHFTGYTDILIGSQSHVEDLVLPIGRLFGILANHGSCCITQSCSRWILLGYCPTEFIRFHYLYPLVRVLHGIGTGIVHLDSVLTPLLGSNDNHPIRSPRAEDGRCRSVLQYGKCFNIVRVDGCQGIGSSRCCIVGYRYTVDNNQRVVRGVQRSPTTDTQSTSGSRLSIAGRNIQSRHFPLNQFLWRSNRPFVHILGLDGHYRTTQVVLLYRAITDDYYLVELFRIFFQYHIHDGGRR